MKNELLYEERVSSNWTRVLFLGLTILFVILLIWCVKVDSPFILKAVIFIIFVFFFFSTVNYLTLIIRITQELLRLKFGIFTWTIPLDNIRECLLDDLPIFMRYGGAGIHFMFIRKRYRASFNFLEHPRIVIVLNKKAGIVQDISFSTRQPEAVIRVLQRALSSRGTA